MKKNIITSFQRYEVKYYLTKAQREAIEPLILEHFTVDEFGKHTISNIYYDTDNFEITRESIDKPVYKEKLRLRAYGVPDRETGKVFLEIKKKFEHVVYKRRIHITVPEADAFLNEGILPTSSDPQITREIAHFLDLHHPKPKVFLSYERVALFGKEDSELRITFDTNLLYREHDLDLCLGAYGQRVVPEGVSIMEIKVPGTMPLWLAHSLSEHGIFHTSFSKVGTAYKDHILHHIFSEGNAEHYVY